MLAVREELLKIELSEEEKEKFKRLEAEFKKLLPQIEERYPAMFKAFVKGESIEPQGVFGKIE